MKKQIAILLSATALLTGLSACSSKPSTDSSTDKKTETVKKSSKSEEKKASSEVKKSSKQSSSEKTDNFDLMIEAAQSQIENLKQLFAGTYSDITITKGEGHTIVYTYTYAKDPIGNIDFEALKPTLVKGMKPTMDGVKAIIPDAKIQVIYQRPDHSELGNITITQEDTDSIS